MEWRHIPGYLGLYEVSDEGHVRNAKGVLLAGYINKAGYRRVTLSKDKRKRHWGVHQLVLKAFRRKSTKTFQGCHNDGNPSHNSLSNLRWGSVRSNSLDKLKHGTMPYGELVHNSVVSEDDVRVIRARHKAGTGISVMAKERGVNYYTIANIVHRKSWKHVK